MQGNILSLALLETTAVTKDKASCCVSRSHLLLLATPFQWSSKSSFHFSILRYPNTCYFKENKRGLLLIQQHCLRLVAVSFSCNSVCSQTAHLELYRITQWEWWEVAAGALEGIVPTTKDHQEASGGCSTLAPAGSPHGGPFPFLICGVPFGGLHGGGQLSCLCARLLFPTPVFITLNFYFFYLKLPKAFILHFKIFV